MNLYQFQLIIIVVFVDVKAWYGTKIVSTGSNFNLKYSVYMLCVFVCRLMWMESVRQVPETHFKSQHRCMKVPTVASAGRNTVQESYAACSTNLKINLANASISFVHIKSCYTIKFGNGYLLKFNVITFHLNSRKVQTPKFYPILMIHILPKSTKLAENDVGAIVQHLIFIRRPAPVVDL